MLFIMIALTAVGFTDDSPAVPASLTEARYECSQFNDLRYREGRDGSDPLQKLNLVLPKGAIDYPLLVWIGGGAWSYVDRNMEMDFARQLASRGIGVSSVGHRLSAATWKDPALAEGIRHPCHIEDVAEAFRWIHEQAATYGYARGKIFVGGFSSGGHLAALLSMDGRRLEGVGLAKSDIRGVIPIAGAYDISDYHRYFLSLDGDDRRMADLHVKAVFGDHEKDFEDASPTTYVKEMTVPMLLVSERSTYRYTKIFEEQIRTSKFDDVVVVNFHRFGHGELWKNLSYGDASECRDLIIRFIRSRSSG